MSEKRKDTRPKANGIPPGTDWRLEKNVGEQSRAISAARLVAAIKEHHISTSNGPFSIPDGHYEKSYFLPKDRA